MKKQQKKTKEITAPVYMMNRELSWLKFNNRSKNSLTSIGDGMNCTFEHICSNS